MSQNGRKGKARRGDHVLIKGNVFSFSKLMQQAQGEVQNLIPR